jgi:hypothetical protein
VGKTTALRAVSGIPALDPCGNALLDDHPLAAVLSADPRQAGNVRQVIAVSLASPAAAFDADGG